MIRDGTFSSGRAVSEQVEGFVAVVVEDGNQGVGVHCSGGEKKYDVVDQFFGCSTQKMPAPFFSCAKGRCCFLPKHPIGHR